MTNAPAPLPARTSRTELRILAGARRCIETNGIDRTTIVDIAEAADYTRPVIYKYFSDKNAIVDHLCMEEMQGIQHRLNSQLDRAQSYGDVMTQAILLGVTLARENIYIRRFMQDHASWVRSQTESGLVHLWVSGQWNRFLLRGREGGDLAPDIDIDETVTWIALVQSLLLLRFDNDDMDEAKMRRFVRRFVVAPLLA
jgi:AcrR family transcriptional regulator